MARSSERAELPGSSAETEATLHLPPGSVQCNDLDLLLSSICAKAEEISPQCLTRTSACDFVALIRATLWSLGETPRKLRNLPTVSAVPTAMTYASAVATSAKVPSASKSDSRKGQLSSPRKKASPRTGAKSTVALQADPGDRLRGQVARAMRQMVRRNVQRNTELSPVLKKHCEGVDFSKMLKSFTDDEIVRIREECKSHGIPLVLGFGFVPRDDFSDWYAADVLARAEELSKKRAAGRATRGSSSAAPKQTALSSKAASPQRKRSAAPSVSKPETKGQQKTPLASKTPADAKPGQVPKDTRPVASRVKSEDGVLPSPSSRVASARPSASFSEPFDVQADVGALGQLELRSVEDGESIAELPGRTVVSIIRSAFDRHLTEATQRINRIRREDNPTATEYSVADVIVVVDSKASQPGVYSGHVQLARPPTVGLHPKIKFSGCTVLLDPVAKRLGDENPNPAVVGVLRVIVGRREDCEAAISTGRWALVSRAKAPEDKNAPAPALSGPYGARLKFA